MKSKRRWLLLIVPLALFAWAYQAASWRPKLVGVQPPNSTIVQRQLVPGGAFSGSQISISSDGRNLASLAVGKFPDDLTMFSLVTRQKLWHRAQQGEGIGPPVFSPDGRTFAVAIERTSFVAPRDTFNLLLLDTTTGKQRGPQILSSRDIELMQCAAFLSPRELVISAYQSATVADTQTGHAIRKIGFDSATFYEDPKMLLSAQSHVSADGKTVLALANGKSDTRVFIYDTQTGKLRGKWKYPGVFRNPRLSPDGTLWAMQPENVGLFDVYDAKIGKKLHQFAGDNTNQLWTWSADSQRILSSPGAFMAISDARTGRDLGQLPGTRDTQALVLDPRGDYFYTLDGAGKIWRWRLR